MNPTVTFRRDIAGRCVLERQARRMERRCDSAQIEQARDRGSPRESGAPAKSVRFRSRQQLETNPYRPNFLGTAAKKTETTAPAYVVRHRMPL